MYLSLELQTTGPIWLTQSIDAENIDASLKDGVLTVRIPKRSEFKPRRIEVKV